METTHSVIETVSNVYQYSICFRKSAHRRVDEGNWNAPSKEKEEIDG